MAIQMNDLKSQLSKIKNEINSAIGSVFDNAMFIQGKDVFQFEDHLKRYIGIHHSITCANGTDALQIALMASEFYQGDEVIVPSFTYVASAEAIALLGLKPVFADVDYDTFNLTLKSITDSYTEKTKCIIPVHLYGQSVSMEELLNFASINNIQIIEDAAQSIGCKYTFSNGNIKQTGTMSTMGITSFFPSKNLGCYGDGGAIFTNSKELAKKIRMIANHGQEKKYYHDLIGVNSRLDTIQAAILSVKLKYLDSFNNQRKKAAGYYDKSLKECPFVTIPYRTPYSDHVYHQYTIKVDARVRNSLKDFLSQKGIPTAIYYPLPLHLQKAYAYLGYKKGDFPVSEKLCTEVLSLPMHTELTESQLDYICSTIHSFFK